jgi:hypothetical protein
MSQFHFKQEKRWNDSRVYEGIENVLRSHFVHPSHLAYGAGGGNVFLLISYLK